MTDILHPELATGVNVVSSISGGKDSTALALALTEAEIEARLVFADTGWEHESTYDHLEYLRGVLGPIDVVRGPNTFTDVVKIHKMFPSQRKVLGGGARFCTSELKVLPIIKYLVEIAGDNPDSLINAVGIRADESIARSKLDAVEYNESTGFKTWRPILRWSEEDVVEIHKRHDVRLHPLYRLGATRVGCWPCIGADKQALRLVSSLDPDRISEIREIEIVLSAGKDSPRTMFSYRRPGETKFKPAFIDEIIDWSSQIRGGYLLGFGEDDWACMRWGFCEVSS